jgi:23S rRNA (uracil1939-C5)-methyltransferase
MPADLLIHELAPKGDGVHRSRTGSVYVDRTLPGDRVQAVIRRDEDGVLRGDLRKLINASPHRVQAPCPNYPVCGNCTLQHAKDDFYRHWKTELVRAALRSKGLKPRVWREPVFLPAGDRRRATFNAYKQNNIVVLGHYRRRAHAVTDIAQCLVADPTVMDMRARLTSLLALILPDGKPAMAFIQAVDGEVEIVITGPVGRTGKPDGPVREAMARFVRDAKVSRLAWRADPDDAAQIIVDISPLRARFGALDIILPPLAFLQPTQAGEQALVASVMALLPPTGTFADLFSGCGTFTGPMLERGAVDAYESVGAAIRALDKAKGVLPLKAIRRDLFANPLRRDEANRYDAIVFDPPRAGAEEQVRNLASAKTPLLVGVSCNPATFARDARILADGGYRLDSVRVVDQFTWSHHVELVAAFTKRSR